MLALVTADPGEPTFEIAAVQEFADHFRDGRAKGAKIGLVLFGIPDQARRGDVARGRPNGGMAE
jgi:hypothetical protein